MSTDAVSVSCAIGLHHHEEGDPMATCPGTRATIYGSQPCECRCHRPAQRRRR